MSFGERESSTSGARDLMARRLPLSVIVSTHESAATLAEVLLAIRASDLPRDSYELIVVDDASSDSSIALAARHADTVVKLSGRASGPAYARNRGVEIARGEVVAFVDDDVIAGPRTLSQMMATLAQRPDVDAVSASHDENAGQSNFVSQYWNVLLRFGEQRHPGLCAQFAPGCGAVRRAAFISAGMYDEWRFGSACLESVELGERLLRAGRRAYLNPVLKVSHLKRWDVRSVCREVWHRARLLARSLGYTRMSALAPGEVVFTLTRSLTPAIAVVGTVLLAGAFVPPPHEAIEAALTLLILLSTNVPLHRFYAQERGFIFAIASAPIHLLVQIVAALALCYGWGLRYLIGDASPDATTQAYSEVGLEIWPPVPRKTPMIRA